MSRTIRPVALFVALSTAALPLVHGLSALLREFVAGPPVPLPLSAACVLVVALASGLARSRNARRSALVSTLAGALLGATLALGFGAVAAGLAGLLAAPLLGLAALRLNAFLPRDLEARAAMRPWIAPLWTVLGLLCVAQTVRIASFMTDDGLTHGPTIAGFWDHHMCLPAYLQAAELNRAGEANVYDAAHYPGITRDAQPTTQVAGMQHYLEDPYQYPPQFLLLPRALLATGFRFETLRTLWFAAQALLFCATALALARYLGSERGFRVLAWMPLVWVAPVTMFNFQYGQAHLAALCVAVLAMLAFERGREATGGFLLACAVLAKLFPALLLIPLALQRRWSALGRTAAALLSITALSLPVLGTAPYVSFFEYHLPRLFSGDAFAFQEVWPESAVELIASNQSMKGLTDKLVLLGWPAAASAKALLGVLYSGAVLLLVAHAARRARTPHARATLWLCALTLGALCSPGAWADYVLVSAVWMLALHSAALPASRLARASSLSAWILFVLQPGVLPLIPVGGARGMLSAALLGHIAVLAFCALQLARREPATRARGSRVDQAETRIASLT